MSSPSTIHVSPHAGIFPVRRKQPSGLNDRQPGSIRPGTLSTGNHQANPPAFTQAGDVMDQKSPARSGSSYWSGSDP